MNTSISPSPKNENWPAGHASATSGTAQDSCRKCDAPRDHEHGLDVEDDEQHRDHVELHREALARVARAAECRTRTACCFTGVGRGRIVSGESARSSPR